MLKLTDCVALATIAVVAVILTVPVMSQNFNIRPQDLNNMRIRGIHQAIVSFSENNNGYYPGFDNGGQLLHASTEFRFKALVDQRILSPYNFISPMETLVPWSEGTFTRNHYSYAMLELDSDGHDSDRNTEWRRTDNGKAVILSDRNTGYWDSYSSLWSSQEEGTGWRGAVAWNDDHVSFEKSHTLVDTQFGKGGINESDSLFDASSHSDALMTFSKGEIPMPKRSSGRPAETVECCGAEK